MIRKYGLAALVIAGALIANKKDVLLAKLRGAAAPQMAKVVGDENAKKLLDKVAPSAAAPAAEAKPAAEGEDTTAVPAAPIPMELPDLRKNLKTAVAGERDETPAPEPPKGVLEKVMYDAPLGKNVAYITPVKPGAKGPAIVWIHGGFNWGLDSTEWEDAPRDNDQSGSAFRKAGIAEMYPALRGDNGNPGHEECFLGEVDDVLAAADFLAKRPDVDPTRIYLGGHSTGAVMALLAVESTTRFRQVFAFGPVANPKQYGPNSCLPAEVADLDAEWRPRAPIEWLHQIATPTLIIEGEQGNAAVFPMMQKRSGRAPIRYVVVPGATHFTDLGPGSELIAKAILADTGPKRAFDSITGDAIKAAIASP